ncbi:N-acetyltransferase [Desulfurococcaceae archaeon MEX13E-LK6-19]|nr:N-acetyltransferase [Desulfurococcaceae archaeon MEX13E-LK6-19]
MERNDSIEIKHTSTVIWARLPDNTKAYIKYEIRENRMLILETYTPPQHRGKGIAKKLMEYAVKLAEEKNLYIEPICSYSIYYFTKNPDKKYILAPEYRDVDLEQLWRSKIEEEGRKK